MLFPVVSEEELQFKRLELEEGLWKGRGIVFLAEDEVTVRAIGERQLARLGFNVLTLENGLEAVSMYKERHDEIDLVIFDLTMPKMGGEDAFREWRSINPAVKVVLVRVDTRKWMSFRALPRRKLQGFFVSPIPCTN